MANREIYVGIMSGTSLDGVDAVVAEFGSNHPVLLSSCHQPFDAALRGELLSLTSPGNDEINRAGGLGNRLAVQYAAAARLALRSAGIAAGEVRAIGCHGQTVRHRPEHGFTLQIGNAALLAELCEVTVVSDFRSRDLAAGGQGAPLVPGFHAAMFASGIESRVVLNIGGIANITWLPRNGPISGFDCGPGNCLLDLWAERHLGVPIDTDGEWAAGGRVLPHVLERLLSEPFLALAPPKSTGRELFNAQWLESHSLAHEDPRAVQATLLEFTARCIALARDRHCQQVDAVIVCGGGARNRALLRRVADLLEPALVEPSDAQGVDPRLVEALAFAWLARQTLSGLPSSLPSVTGARGPRVLGAIYPR